MFLGYALLISKRDNVFFGKFPDFPNIKQEGNNLEDVICKCRDLLRAETFQGNESLPKPTKVSRLTIGINDYIVICPIICDFSYPEDIANYVEDSPSEEYEDDDLESD